MGGIQGDCSAGVSCIIICSCIIRGGMDAHAESISSNRHKQNHMFVMFVSNLACWLYFYEHLSRRMLLRFVMYDHKRFKIFRSLAVQLCSLWPVVLCGSQRIAFHHVSSWHKGESRRPRTFLELRLQTVSLVGNLLTPVTSHVLFRYSELKKQENDTDSSSLLGFFYH